MRKTAFWQSPHVRVSLPALVALAVIALAIGCGGGGGGGGNANANNNGNGNNNGVPPGQNPTLPFVSGRVVDTSTPPSGVINANITLFGTGVPDLPARVTTADGSFTIANVDPRYTSFSVTSPDTSRWYNYALYNSKQYDTINCRLPLPALVAGNNNLPTNVAMYTAGNNPPPPPSLNGCP